MTVETIGGFITFISFLVFIVGFLMLIIQLIRRKKKRNALITILLSVILLYLGFSVSVSDVNGVFLKIFAFAVLFLVAIKIFKKFTNKDAVNNIDDVKEDLQNINTNEVKTIKEDLREINTTTTKESENMDKKLEKTVQSIIDFAGKGFNEKNLQLLKEGIANAISSMSEEEELLHAFKASSLRMNGGRESIVSCIGMITNKRFYYAGCEGKAILSYSKNGSVELKDVHAITIGTGTMSTPPYVQFEVKNDDYRITTFDDTKLIKEKLEDGIKACEDMTNAPTIIQNNVSAADELKKFKELLDMGIITQEEFDAKKKQLLGL